MADPDPITDANLRGDRVILLGQRTDGSFIPIRVSNDGSIETSAGDGAGQLPMAAPLADGTPNPSVPSLGSFAQFYDPVGDAWNRAQASEDPGIILGPKLGLLTHILSGFVTVTTSQSQLVIAAPGAGVEGQVFYTPQLPSTLGPSDTLRVTIVGTATVTQGDGHAATRPPWTVAGTDGASLERLATRDAQTDGSQKTIVRGGAKGATVAADVTSTDEGADHQALDVQAYHGGTAIDPRQIRALTTSDQITIGTALPTGANTIGAVTGPGAVALATQATLASLLASINALLLASSTRPTYYVHAFGVAPANLKSMISLAYSAGTSLVLRTVVITNVQTASISGTVIDFQLRRFATHSGGVEVTSFVAVDSASPALSGVTAKTGATIAGEVASPIHPPWQISADEYSTGTLEIENIQVALGAVLGLLRPRDQQTEPPRIRPGEGLHILCNTNTTNGTFNISLGFTVEP